MFVLHTRLFPLDTWEALSSIYFPTLMMETVDSSETYVIVYQTVRRHIPVIYILI